MSFTYRIESVPNAEVIYFSGRILDRTDSDELFDEFNQLLAEGKQKFIINLGEIDYMNSAGLGVLISMLNNSRDSYGKVILCETPEKIKKLITLSKLQNIFELTENQADALKRFEK